jgi:hypothetical protein
MNFQPASGKKFQDSAFCHESFELLKRDEKKIKLLINISYLITLLLLEFFVLSVITRF